MTKREKITCKALFVLYCITSLIIVFHHEIWADEAQAWLVARDLNLTGIFTHVRTEGHPLLWYFLITPFAKLNFPVLSMQILNWFFVCTGVFLFLWKAPFNFFSKISLLLSAHFLYWFPALARSYCLIPALIFSLAIFYKKQKEHPYIYAALLVLLANTHIIMFGFCFALAVLFFIENREKKSLLPVTVIFTGLFCVAAYLYGSQNENLIVKSYFVPKTLNGMKLVFDVFVLHLFGSSKAFYTSLTVFFLLSCAGILYVQNKKIFFVYLFNLLYQFSLFIFFWGLMPQRVFALILASIFCLWVTYDSLKNTKLKVFENILIAAVFLASAQSGFDFIKRDFYGLFSDGKNTAQFIKTHIPDNAFIISNCPLTTTSVSAYLPKNRWKLYYPGYNDFYTYTIWNKDRMDPRVPLPIEDLLNEHEEIYILLSNNTFFSDIRPIYSSPQNIMTHQEIFYIYNIKREDYEKQKRTHL